jgi:hypothetical protein
METDVDRYEFKLVVNRHGCQEESHKQIERMVKEGIV